MRRLRAVFGTGGYARSIVPVVRVQCPDDWVVFAEDEPQVSTLNAHTVMPFEQVCRISDASMVVAEPDPALRRRIVQRCEAAGLAFFVVRPVRMVAMDDIEVGNGAIFSPYTTVTSNVRIGAHFHCNIYSYVDHDCVIGDFVTFAPRVCCNGGVAIGDDVTIGAGAVIGPGLTIGAGALIDMGAVVTADVPPGAHVGGHPARILRNNRAGS